MDNSNSISAPIDTYDYIIAGAGCAGLSLLHYLVGNPLLSDKKILVIDRSLKKTNDRTWCFWEQSSGSYEHLVKHQWETISIHASLFNKELTTAPFSYKMIQGIDFYNDIMQVASANSNIYWKEATITNMEVHTDSNQKYASVYWEGGVAKAKIVFTSMLPFQMNSLNSAYTFDTKKGHKKSTPFLWQHFKGRVVHFEQSVFNEKVARLMDFNVPQQGATAFMYLLPLNEKEALVEYTVFSDLILETAVYDHILDAYLNKVFPKQIYAIQHEEIGAIPMTLQIFTEFDAPIYKIGAVGDAIKASSGYAFQFIQLQCKNIIDQLVKGNTIDTKVHTTRHRFYDAVLLHILFYHKMNGSEIFKRIFAKNKAATVFKFLSNTSTFWEDIQIMRSLPTRIFLPAALLVLCRRG